MQNSVAPEAADAVVHEPPPQNGIPGLKHWRYDLLGGFVVSLVSLPLSSGIAIASGAPPIYGIISSIIAGLIFPFIGGSFVTISGPAAGLAPALMATMVALGGAGDADTVGAGYPLLLVVIFFAGLMQVAMAKMNLARYAAVFPASAVEGMLGAIGILILVKALPLFFGYVETTHAHGFLEYVASVPEWWAHGNSIAFGIAAGTLVIMLAANSKQAKQWALFAKVPPHLFGVLFAVPAAIVTGLGTLDPRFLIVVPANPLDGLSLPDFQGLWSQPDLWWAALVGVITLMLIDGVESLATAQAIDRIDPFKRQSIPDRVLLAMGLSNMASSLVGGLTVIPGGVKSKTCIEAGGRTLWANFVNAMFLLCFLFLAPSLVALLPKAALGAILVYTGWKMMHPSIARGLAKVGTEQVVVYGATIVAILLTDLLIGILIGTGLKLAYVTAMRWRERPDERLITILRELFADPVEGVDDADGAHVLHVAHPLVSFNAYRLMERVEQERKAGFDVTVSVEPTSGLIDHTSMETLHRIDHDIEHAHVSGVEGLHARTEHPMAVRYGTDGGTRVVLVAVPPTGASLDFLQTAASLAKGMGGSMQLFCVINPSDAVNPHTQLAETTQDAFEQEARVVRERLAKSVQAALPSGSVEIIVRQGDPSEAILDQAREAQPQFLVMASRGQSGLRRALMGSVAEDVTRRATCPVVVVPPGWTPARPPVLALSA